MYIPPVTDDFVDYIQNYFQERCQSEPEFSLRKFAKELGMDASNLSKILKRQRNISKTLFKKMASHFKLSKKDRDNYSKWVDDVLKKKFLFEKVSPEIFARPFVHAVVELLQFDRYQKDVGLIADKIGMPSEECRQIIDQLAKNKIVEIEGEKCILAKKNLMSSGLSKNYLNEIFTAAAQSIARDPIDRRYHLGSVMIINQEDLPEIKERFRKFYADLIHWNKSRKNRDEIYQLGIGFNKP